MVQISLRRQLFDLAEALHAHQLVAQATQRTAADAGPTQMLNLLSGFRPEKRGAGSHGHHHAGILPGKCQSPGAAGLKLVHPAGGQAEYIPLYKAGAHTGEYHAAHVLQGQPVAFQIIAEGSVQAGHLILCPDAEHGDHAAVCPQTHDFGGGAANINA